MTGFGIERRGDRADALGQLLDEEIGRRGVMLRSAGRCASRSAADVTFSGCTSAIGWTPMCSLMMNSMRARPTPSLGSIAVRKARSGLPRLTMIAGARPVERRQVDDASTSNGSLPGIDVADLALGAGHGDHVRRCCSLPVAFAGADHRRNAELARHDGGMAGAPAAVGDDGGGASSSPAPSPGWWSPRPALRRAGRPRGRRCSPMTRTGPAAIFSPTARPVTQRPGRCPSARRSRMPAQAALRGDRLGPGLDDVELAVDAVLRPFDVHRHRMAGAARNSAPRCGSRSRRVSSTSASLMQKRSRSAAGVVDIARCVCVAGPRHRPSAAACCPSERRSTAR